MLGVGTGTEKPVFSTRENAPSRQKTKISPAWIILPLVLVAVIAFAVWGLPPLAARLAPTPTPTATATHTHTSTPTLTPEPSPTPKPTDTIMPTPTVDLTTGTVTGSIYWASKPFEGVVVKLCTDWSYTCKGIEYSAVTDAQGVFTITGVEPGDYQFITKNPEQFDETRLMETNINWLVIEVSGGQEVNLGSVTVCKHDLFIIRTIQGSSVTFSWKAYPGATKYSASGWSPSSGQTFSSGSTSSTSFSANLGTGNYEVSVSADGPDGLCAVGWSIFTIP